MSFIVQNFDGTSISSAARIKKAENIAQETLSSGVSPIVVLSAIRGRKKQDDTTSKLLKASAESIREASLN